MNPLAPEFARYDTLMKIAAAMREDRLGYKPTPLQRQHGMIPYKAEANPELDETFVPKRDSPVIGHMKVAFAGRDSGLRSRSFRPRVAGSRSRLTRRCFRRRPRRDPEPFPGQSTRAWVSFGAAAWDVLVGQMTSFPAERHHCRQPAPVIASAYRGRIRRDAAH